MSNGTGWIVWRRDTESTRPDEWVEVDSGSRAYCEDAAARKNQLAMALDPTVEFRATVSSKADAP